MLDKDGYRPNVGIVLINKDKKVLLAKRKNQDYWQFPQGGINYNESEIDALYRELYEEVGLKQDNVKLIAKTQKWLRYNLPKDKINAKSKFIGQKQVWFLLKIYCSDNSISLNKHHDIEFDDWSWVEYWHPIDKVIDFKKAVYEDMLKSLAPIAFNNDYIIPKHLNRKFSCSAISVANL